MGHSGIKKHNFKLKYKLSDGNILQVHHTICPSSGKVKLIRFLSIVFDDICDRFACSDHHGNIFVFDMVACDYWPLSGHEPSSVAAFATYQRNLLMLATTCPPFNLIFIDAETGNVVSKLSGHNSKIKMVKLSSKHDLLLTSTGSEAIIWELKGRTLYFKLNLCIGEITDIGFSPVSDNVVACFKNDNLCVWRRKNFKSLKITLCKELRKVKSFAYNKNGRIVVIGTYSTLSVHDADTWEVTKLMDTNKLNIHGVKQLLFLPQPLDGGCNNILAVLSMRRNVHLVNLECLTLITTISIESSNVSKIATSNSGKYLACVLKMGHINIYKSGKLLNNQAGKPSLPADAGGKTIKRKFTFESIELDQEVDECLSEDRLSKILSQFSQYPDKHRLVIWKRILKTPNNYDAYCDLMRRPVHPCCRKLDKCITIRNSTYLKHTKRLMSSLMHWCPVLAELDYLNILVFPFVKILHQDPMFCFETVATILKNYCQLWFEYCPLPPINVLSMVENVLGEHDRCLLAHFCVVGVTSKVYAFKLMSSAFSEVLSPSEWLILWDHILSNETSFILMAIVAYSLIHRNTLKSYCSIQQFEEFFSTQKCTNMKALIKKTKKLLKETSYDNHPKQYLKEFTPLRKGLCYEQCQLRVVGIKVSP